VKIIESLPVIPHRILRIPALPRQIILEGDPPFVKDFLWDLYSEFGHLVKLTAKKQRSEGSNLRFFAVNHVSD
jgi:hypothetical protein